MKAREFHPRRLDVRHFAESGDPLAGSDAIDGFERLLQLRHTEAALDTASPVVWAVQGELRPQRGGPPQVWLHLSGSTAVSQQCQRCLEGVEVPLAFDRWFLFVENERQAAELDADAEEDVLVLSRQFDLLELVEDELLLVAPIVPRHDICPVPVRLSAGEEDLAAAPSADATAPDGTQETTPSPHPFAALAALRKDSC